MIGEMMPAVSYQDLRDFVEREMKSRQMNISQFARFIGVSHTTIGRLIDPQNPTTPSPELLVALAEKTGVNYSALTALILPAAEQTELDPKTVIRAERIGQLTPEQQEHIDEIIGTYILSSTYAFLFSV